MLGTDDRLLGLDLEHLVVDGCITKAPCGGEVAGRGPVDRRKRLVAVEPAAPAGRGARPGQPARRRAASGHP